MKKGEENFRWGVVFLGAMLWSGGMLAFVIYQWAKLLGVEW